MTRGLILSSGSARLLAPLRKRLPPSSVLCASAVIRFLQPPKLITNYPALISTTDFNELADRWRSCLSCSVQCSQIGGLWVRTSCSSSSSQQRAAGDCVEVPDAALAVHSPGSFSVTELFKTPVCLTFSLFRMPY